MHRRTTFLARLRNIALELALAQWLTFDALLMLDADVVAYSPLNYVQAFATAHLLNASAFFGLSVYRNVYGHLVPYDRSSVRPSWPRRSWDRVLKRGPFGVVAVKSAFGGFGTYWRRSLVASGARYTASTNGVPEHVAFNVALGEVSRPLLLDLRFMPLFHFRDMTFCVKHALNRSDPSGASACRRSYQWPRAYFPPHPHT